MTHPHGFRIDLQIQGYIHISTTHRGRRTRPQSSRLSWRILDLWSPQLKEPLLACLCEAGSGSHYIARECSRPCSLGQGDGQDTTPPFSTQSPFTPENRPLAFLRKMLLYCSGLESPGVPSAGVKWEPRQSTRAKQSSGRWELAARRQEGACTRDDCHHIHDQNFLCLA